MNKIVILILSLNLIVFASFVEYNYDNRDLEVLSSFDIDSSFINDKTYLKLKNSIQTDQKEIFLKRLDNAHLLIPLLKQKIKDAHIPESFLYLAMAESNFSLRAYSKKRAVGLWQFMPATAKRYKLNVNMYVDERRDILKSTDAAIAYLKNLHDYYDKWYLAILSYNCGEGRVMEAIIRASIDKYVGHNKELRKSSKVIKMKKLLKRLKKGRVYIKTALKEIQILNVQVNLNDLLKVQKRVRRQYLPNESRYYIRKILAYATMATEVKYLTDDGSEYLLNRGLTIPITHVTLKGGIHLGEVAASIDMPLGELMEYNKHLNYKLTPTYAKSYNIYIPYNKLAYFKSNYNPNNSKNRYVIHRVTKGDNLGYIGKKYGLNYKIIKNFNNLKSNMLSLNQKLIIPIFIDSNVNITYSKYYTVKKGDTISSISKRYRTTITQLKADNRLLSDIIKIGDRLVLN